MRSRKRSRPSSHQEVHDEHSHLPAGTGCGLRPAAARTPGLLFAGARLRHGTASAKACSTSWAAGSDWLRPLLRLTTGEEAFFPEYGERIPFRIENHAHEDPFGRSSLTARREIRFPGRTRIFQDTTSVADTPGRRPAAGGLRGPVPAAGHRPEPQCHAPRAGSAGVSEASRLFLGPLRIPLPAALDAKAYAEQWWDPAEGGTRQAPDPGESHPAADRPGPGVCRAASTTGCGPTRAAARRRSFLPALRAAGPLGGPHLTVPPGCRRGLS